MRFLSLFLLLFLLSFSFAALLWTFDSSGQISTQPISVDRSRIFFTSQDGNAYMISQDGLILWKRNVGNYMLQPAMFGDNIVVVTTTGRFVEFKKDGTIVRDFDLNTLANLSYVYGIDSDYSRVYISTSSGIVALNKDGSPYLLYNLTKNVTSLTPPTPVADVILVGVDNELLAIKNDGKLKWKTTLGTMWKSKPVVASGTVFVATLDDAFYGVDLNSGAVKFEKRVDGWVTGNPIVVNQNIYFGTTRGFFYNIDSVTGGIVWKIDLGAGITTTVVKGTLGGREAIFIGSDDSNLYVIDAQSGELIWIWGGAKAKLGSPLFHYGTLVVPSYDKTIYALSTEKVCFIKEPEAGSTIGPKEVKLKGTVVSEGDNDVYVRVEGGQWEKARINGSSWTFTLDPTPLSAGFNTIECKVGADEAEPSFSYYLNIDKSIPLGKLALSYPPAVNAGEEFNISVADAENGEPVEDFSVILNGKTLRGTGAITLKLDEPGKVNIKIKKTGFEDADITIEVKGGINIVLIAVAVLIVLALSYFYFFIYKRK